jgi:hypothetical protein
MKTFKQFLDEAKKVKIYTDKPIGWKVEDVGANKKVVKTTKSKGWKDEKIQELFGFMEPKPQPKPDTKVLAYKNYQPGELE